jgi:predicted permease
MPSRIDWIASFRRLRSKPLYALSIALALGIGVGSATIFFTWFEGLFLRPIPAVRDSHALQIFQLRRADYETTAFSHPDYQEMAEGLDSFMDVTAYSMTRVTLTGAGRPEQHWALFVSPNFFSVLELKPGAGRLLGASDTTREPAAVLGYDSWRTRFGADPTAVGRTIYLNGQPVKIAGVAPPGFEGPYTGLSLDLYLPVALSDVIEGGTPRMDSRRAEWLSLMARLKQGVSAEQASEGARVVVARLDKTYPKGAFHEAQILLKPLWKSPVGAQAIMGPVMIALAGIVAVVLLLACTNAAGIMLLENSLRRRDLSIRVSLGAGRSGLIGYCLAEAVLLSVLAAAAALFITNSAADHLQDLVPDIQFPVKLNFPIDGRVLGFSITVAALAAIFCGLWSGLEARWQCTALTLRSNGSAMSPSRDRSRLRGIFIGAQIALSFVLLSSAALFYRSVERARSMDLGFNTQSVSLVRIDLSGNRYTPADGTALFQRVFSRLVESPGVESATVARSVPLGFGDQQLMAIVPEGQSEKRQVWGNRISPGYFATLDIPLKAGRDFNDFDRTNSGRVAIVNEALARKLWNSSSPVGSSFMLGATRYQIVGVAGNTKIWSLTDESQPYLYLPLWQSYATDVTFHVKSQQSPARIYDLVERELERQDPSLPVVSRQTMGQQVEAGVFPQRIALVMLGMFSLLAMYLTAMGLYGLIAHAARSRTKEIAIRMALGASAVEICRLIFRQAAGLVSAGLCAGAILTGLLSQLLSSILIGSEGIDLLSMAGTSALITAVAIFASWLPTLRAMRLQPATALRAD